MRAAARSKTVDAEQDELRGVRARAGARVVRSSQEALGRAGADDDASDARSSRLRERLTAEELQEPSTRHEAVWHVCHQAASEPEMPPQASSWHRDGP